MNAVAGVSLVLACSTVPLGAQTPRDSTPLVPSSSDRYVIDAAKLVRENGARSFSDLLIGQVPGLLVIPGWGLNGSGSRIRFAGVRGLGDDAPLILVDGMRFDAAENSTLIGLDGPGPLRLEDLSVEDVESIDVFRGPASGARYGPGAANGVISIHTKRGRSGPVRWETYAQGVFETVHANWPANYGGVDLDNANPSMRTGGCNLTAQAAGQCVQDFVQSFNPLVQQSPFETVLRRQVGFSGSGGPTWGAFRLAAGFDGDAGPYAIPGVSRAADNFQRWNGSVGGSMHPRTGLDIDFGIARVSSDLRLPTYLPVQAALRGPSDSDQFVWDSVYRYPGGQRLDRTFGRVEVRGTLMSWLTIRGIWGLDVVDQRDGLLVPGFLRFDGSHQVRHNTAAVSASLRTPAGASVRSETTIGVERLGRRLNEATQQGRDTTPLCSAPCALAELHLRTHSLGVYITEQVIVRDKLFITGTLRHDDFKEFRVTATHPGLAVSWVAKEGAPGPLNRLQLRGSYTSAGAPPADFLFFVIVPPGTPTSRPRPDRARAWEVGADAGLSGGQWNARLTFYDTRSNVGRLVPVSLGSPYFAEAKISNRGVEATLAGSLIDRPTLGWDLRLSVWGNRNRLVESEIPPFFVGYQFFASGYPTGSYLASRIKSYADANGDGVIVPSEVVLDTLSVWGGTPYPTQGAAVGSTLRFGRWHVAALLEYRAGQTLFNEVEWARCARFAPTCRGRNDPASSLQTQAIASSALAGASVDYFEDADFLKLRDVSVSFDVPSAAASVVRARGATITLVGRNLLTWTGYSGVDPEAGSYPVSFGGGAPDIADYGTLPPLRSWTLRVQLAY